jgi:hypothetical protein
MYTYYGASANGLFASYVMGYLQKGAYYTYAWHF